MSTPIPPRYCGTCGRRMDPRRRRECPDCARRRRIKKATYWHELERPTSSGEAGMLLYLLGEWLWSLITRGRRP